MIMHGKVFSVGNYLFDHHLLNLDSHMNQNSRLLCLNDFDAIPELDGTRTNAFIMINLSKRVVLIGATSYAGEMKKSIIFCYELFNADQEDVFPMHCSANIGKGR